MTATEFRNTAKDLLTRRTDIVHLNARIRANDILADDYRRSQTTWTAQQTADIAAAINPETSKPLFSNEGARAAELLIRQTNDATHCDCDTQIRDLAARNAQERDTIDSLRAEIEYYKALMDWELSHAPDELNAKLAEIASGIETATADAALRAVKRVLAAVADNTDAAL